METETIVDEINQIKIQYEAELGTSGRKAWPRSIKERVSSLFEVGLSGVKVAELTGLPYFTVLKWRPRQKPRGRNAFCELAVVGAVGPQKLATVTTRQNLVGVAPQKVVTVSVTTPDGYRLEASTPELAIEIVRQLRRPSCF